MGRAAGVTSVPADDAPAYLPVQLPPPGGLMQVAPGVHWLRMPLPMALDHINLWLLEHTDGFVLVDTGMADAGGREVWQALENTLLQSRPLRLIVVTHLHPDHAGLAAWLQQRHRVPVWTSQHTEQQMRQLAQAPDDVQLEERKRFLRSHGLDQLDDLMGSVSGERYRAAVSGVPEVALHPDDGQAVDWGAYRWQWLHMGGHAAGHLCLHTASGVHAAGDPLSGPRAAQDMDGAGGTGGILISGDQILPAISPNVSLMGWGVDPDPLASFLDSLERLAQLDAGTLVLPSHGRPFFGLRARALELRAHHAGKLDRLVGACTEPLTACEAMSVIFGRVLRGFHRFLALGETVAHLEYLAHHGRLERRVDARGVIRFVRPAVQR